MGLLHDQPIAPLRTITVKLRATVRQIRLVCETKWCRQAGDKCFLSGVSFCEVTFGSSLTLMSAVIREELSRRMQQRYPFFHATTIRGGHGTEQTAFCRDISRSGIGLLHRQPIELGRAVLNIADSEGDDQEVSLDVRWCQPAAQDWYLSGAQFAHVWLEEFPSKLI